MLSKIVFVVSALGSVSSFATRADAATLSYITEFTKTANDQQNLFPTFPVGTFTTSDTSFRIVSDANGHNFYDFNNNTAATPLDIKVSVFNPSVVYTLINAYHPNGGPIGSLTFLGTGGAMQTFSLSADPNAPGGANVRDFFQGQFNNTLNDPNAMNVYSGSGQGAGGSGDVNTGASGTYVVDEQRFALSAAFSNQTLTDIILSTTPTAGGVPIFLGATVSSPSDVSSVPLPSSAPMFGAALLSLGTLGYHLKRRKAVRSV